MGGYSLLDGSGLLINCLLQLEDSNVELSNGGEDGRGLQVDLRVSTVQDEEREHSQGRQ